MRLHEVFVFLLSMDDVMVSWCVEGPCFGIENISSEAEGDWTWKISEYNHHDVIAPDSLELLIVNLVTFVHARAILHECMAEYSWLSWTISCNWDRHQKHASLSLASKLQSH